MAPTVGAFPSSAIRPSATGSPAQKMVARPTPVDRQNLTTGAGSAGHRTGGVDTSEGGVRKRKDSKESGKGVHLDLVSVLVKCVAAREVWLQGIRAAVRVACC